MELKPYHLSTNAHTKESISQYEQPTIAHRKKRRYLNKVISNRGYY